MAYDYLSEVRLIKGIGDQEIEVSMVEFDVELKEFSGRVKAGLVDSLPSGVDFLFANDIFCKFCDVQEVSVVTRSMNKSTQPTLDALTEDLNIDSLYTCGSSVGNEPTSSVDNSKQVNDMSGHTHSQSVSSESDSNAETLGKTTLNITREKLVELQNADNKIKRLFSQAIVRPYANSRDFYVVEDGLLMHSHLDKKKGVRSNRIVVPNVLVPKLLELAHDAPLSGHLGYKKTVKRIESHFYWPRFYRSVRSYIRSCDKCQRLDKTHIKVKAPLHPLPIVEEPFSRLIMDVVGPLPECTKSGNRFILTLMDLSTHYPMAIPLMQYKQWWLCDPSME
jgi:hypothetical protein